MKSRFLYLFIILLALNSCKKEEKKVITSEKTPNIEEVVHTEKIECFGFSRNRDTIYMALHITDDSLVEGSLSYSLYEKDQNKGEIRGRLSNDSLFADYSFESEGKNSVREVFFIRTDSGFVEGSTASEIKNNKTVFTNRNFQLNSDFMLKRMDCR